MSEVNVITHHVEIKTREGSSWINLTEKDLEFLESQLQENKQWIRIKNHNFSSVNVVSMSVYKGAWKRPDQR